MKNKIILEIGKNHLGSETLLFKYFRTFNLPEVYGFTIQLRENKFYTSYNKKLKIKNSTILKFKNYCKKYKKYFGLSIQNDDNLKTLNLIKPDFIKVLSYSTENLEFCKRLRNQYNVPIYFSLGLVSKNQSSKFIKNFFKYVSKKNSNIIYTKIEKKLYDFSISEMIYLSNKFKNKLAYGHHFNSHSFPIIMKFMKINTFFLYIKDKKNIKYPDNKNAYNIEDFKKFLNLIFLVEKVK